MNGPNVDPAVIASANVTYKRRCLWHARVQFARRPETKSLLMSVTRSTYQPLPAWLFVWSKTLQDAVPVGVVVDERGRKLLDKSTNTFYKYTETTDADAD